MRDTSAIMRKVKGSNTAPELTFRRALWAKGLRYRVCPPELIGKPDVVFPSQRLTVFVDGDFWHGGQFRRRKLTALEDQFKTTPSQEYWLKKIRRNMRRDCAVTASLLSQGWTVLRFWESDVRKDLARCVEMTMMVLKQRTEPDPFAALLARKTFAEFFAGIGLMRLGLEKAGWRIAYANDIDEQKLKMYRGHFPDANEHFVRDDIHKLWSDTIPVVTLATASFPCNDLSLAGSRSGLKGKQSSAFWGFADLLEFMSDRRPPLLLIENVPGFLTSHGGDDLRQALLALNRLGYRVDAFLLDAIGFVPQSRLRFFIVGVRVGGAETEDQARLIESALRPKPLVDFIRNNADIRWSLRSLPPPPVSGARLVDILEDLPETSSEWWSHERACYLLNQMSARHREIAERMIAAPEWGYGTVFRRMRGGSSMAGLRRSGLPS